MEYYDDVFSDLLDADPNFIGDRNNHVTEPFYPRFKIFYSKYKHFLKRCSHLDEYYFQDLTPESKLYHLNLKLSSHEYRFPILKRKLFQRVGYTGMINKPEIKKVLSHLKKNKKNVSGELMHLKLTWFEDLRKLDKYEYAAIFKYDSIIRSPECFFYKRDVYIILTKNVYSISDLTRVYLKKLMISLKKGDRSLYFERMLKLFYSSVNTHVFGGFLHSANRCVEPMDVKKSKIWGIPVVSQSTFDGKIRVFNDPLVSTVGLFQAFAFEIVYAFLFKMGIEATESSLFNHIVYLINYAFRFQIFCKGTVRYFCPICEKSIINFRNPLLCSSGDVENKVICRCKIRYDPQIANSKGIFKTFPSGSRVQTRNKKSSYAILTSENKFPVKIS